MNRNIRRFDALALFEAVDAQRIERGLSWRRVADQIWDQTSVESFLSPSLADMRGYALPSAGPDRRLRWDLATFVRPLMRRDSSIN